MGLNYILWQKIVSTLLLALILYCGGGGSQMTGVTLNRSYREPVCPGLALMFSCSGTGAQLEIYSPNVLDVFLFFAIESAGTESTNGDSVAVLVDVGVISDGDASMTVNMTLQLPRSTPGGDYVVFCNITTRSGVERFNVANYSVTGVPDSPQIGVLNLNSSHYTEDNVTVLVSWSPVDGADNYSVIVSPSPLDHEPNSSSPSHFTVTNTSFLLTVLFNQPHNITVSAANCGGSSPPSTPLLIRIVNCGRPPVAENVNVHGYSNPATSGSVVSFSCEDQKMLSEQQDTNYRCESNGRWSPDPSGLECLGIGHGLSSEIIVGIAFGILASILVLIALVISVVTGRFLYKRHRKKSCND